MTRRSSRPGFSPAQSRVPSHHIRAGRMTEQDQERFDAATRVLLDSPLDVGSLRAIGHLDPLEGLLTARHPVGVLAVLDGTLLEEWQASSRDRLRPDAPDGGNSAARSVE